MLGGSDEVGVERAGCGKVGPLAVELVEEARRQVQRRVGLDYVVAASQSGEGGQS